MCRRALTDGATDLESVLTVKFEAVLYPRNCPVIYDLAGFSAALRDLKQAVRGRDKLEVTCVNRKGKRESITAF